MAVCRALGVVAWPSRSAGGTSFGPTPKSVSTQLPSFLKQSERFGLVLETRARSFFSRALSLAGSHLSVTTLLRAAYSLCRSRTLLELIASVVAVQL